jgi:hypothetical protein
METYLRQHADIFFTHGICPHCYEEVMAKLPGIFPQDKSE